MADFKRRTLKLSTGKQIKLFGNSIAIGKSLTIGEGYAPNIFSCIEREPEDKPAVEKAKEAQENKPEKSNVEKKKGPTVINPYHLTDAEIVELADYNIRLWMDLKDNVREYGVTSPKIFNLDSLL